MITYSNEMPRSSRVRFATFALVFALLVGGFSAAVAGPTYKKGTYRGKTGTTGRIAFKVDRSGKKVYKLTVSIFALGQDDFGNFTTFQVLASRTDGKKFRLSRSGKFRARGVDSNGIRYDVSGKAKGRTFKGTVEMSDYRFNRFAYNVLTGFFDIPVYELVSGSRPFKAK